MKLLTGLAVLVGATLALSACGGSHAVAITDQQTPGPAVTPASYAYAYLVPADPAHPGRGGYGTLVRWRPINVGDRIPLSVLTTSPSGGEASVWKVVAVQPTPRDGTPAAIRGWFHKKNPILHGRLVLRPAA
jgi:hypothetical protein